MSILIKGMEMPDKCGHCRFANAFDCTVTGSFISTHSIRQPDCPLVPVPEHGDLVDLKAPFKAQYYDEMTEEWLEKTVTVEDVLYGCMVDKMPPTIIPAEEGEG